MYFIYFYKHNKTNTKYFNYIYYVLNMNYNHFE